MTYRIFLEHYLSGVITLFAVLNPLAHGYSGASMEVIAEAALVSKPTLYSHFRSKQELSAAVIAGQCEALLSTLSRVQTGQRDPAASVKAIACAFVVLMYSNEAMDLYRLAIAEQRNFPELGELISRFGPEPIFGQLSSHLADLNARGILHIPNVDIASQLFLGMLQSHKHFRCLMGLQPGLSEAEEKESIIDAAVSLFLKGHGYEV